MTHAADNFWIKAGISSDELGKVKGRTALYLGIATMMALSASFAALSLVNLL